MPLFDVLLVARGLACAFFAILFLQSGIDKIVDRKGNLSWMVPHFEASPLKGTVPMMLSVMTLIESLTGLACFVGLLGVAVPSLAAVQSVGLAASCLALVMLFFGQRLAKDYAGAATLATYFAAALLGLALTGVTKLP